MQTSEELLSRDFVLENVADAGFGMHGLGIEYRQAARRELDPPATFWMVPRRVKALITQLEFFSPISSLVTSSCSVRLPSCRLSVHGRRQAIGYSDVWGFVVQGESNTSTLSASSAAMDRSTPL